MRDVLGPLAGQQQLEAKAAGREMGQLALLLLLSSLLPGGLGGCECAGAGGVVTTVKLPGAHYSLTEIQGIAQEM